MLIPDFSKPKVKHSIDKIRAVAFRFRLGNSLRVMGRAQFREAVEERSYRYDGEASS